MVAGDTAACNAMAGLGLGRIACHENDIRDR
jgi:hypothetical protein